MRQLLISLAIAAVFGGSVGCAKRANCRVCNDVGGPCGFYSMTGTLPLETNP